MTIEEAIKNRENCLEYLEKCGPLATKENVEAVRLSLEALREKAEREKYKPLTREKLVELIKATPIAGVDIQITNAAERIISHVLESIADHLIANGVTVQEWISLSERKPEESGMYITFGCTAVPVRWSHNFDKDIGKFGVWWNYEPDGKEHPQYRFIEAGNITHWMPLPQPPKGE